MTLLPVGVCLSPFNTSYHELRAAAQQLDMLGYESLWLWDHYVAWQPEETVLEGPATLAALAEVTTRIRLGPLVANNTNRHPGRLAKLAATINEIAGGRFVLGIGAGGFAPEQESFGIDQGSAAERVARTAEALQIIPALWTGQPVTFTGQYYRLEDARCVPAQQPAPPIIVGANSPRMAAVGARYADGVNIAPRGMQRLPAIQAAIAAELSARGRDPASFDLSLHPRWSEFARDPVGRLEAWAAQGFTRVMVYMPAPLVLDELARVARAVGYANGAHAS
jgi:alkanesulfonate monooxygenase SsuD/methylene tetrahydromethanopterin reductase-like flavin-dependent oxidoreductase (luciferase family)